MKTDDLIAMLASGVTPVDANAAFITVSTAYTNANFGSGNSFNNRANVSGAGQILAAGNVAPQMNVVSRSANRCNRSETC